MLALPEVQEQCAQFQVITVVSKSNHYVNHYRRERQCLAVMADPRDSPDTQWMRDWMTDLQVIRPLRDTNRRVKQLETQEAAPLSPLLVAYSNPQNVRFADSMASHLSTGQPRCSGGRARAGGRQCKGSANPTEAAKSHRRRSSTGVEERHQNAQAG